jgi:tetratricopeptide (TPR) repeat protein
VIPIIAWSWRIGKKSEVERSRQLPLLLATGFADDLPAPYKNVNDFEGEPKASPGRLKSKKPFARDFNAVSGMDRWVTIVSMWDADRFLRLVTFVGLQSLATESQYLGQAPFTWPAVCIMATHDRRDMKTTKSLPYGWIATLLLILARMLATRQAHRILMPAHRRARLSAQRNPLAGQRAPLSCCQNLCNPRLAYALAAGVAWWLSLAGARAHGPLHEQIEAVTAQIQQRPTAELFLKRGELYRAHQDRDAALKDYQRAAELAPAMDAVLLCRGQTLYEAGKLEPAREALTQFLRRRPDHAEGYLSRARVLAALKDFPAATADYDRAIKFSAEPRPEFFAERARVLVAAGDLDRALAGLDAGLKQLGTLPTFQLLAVEIELKRQRFDAALERVDAIMAQSERKETWLAQRGDILAQGGRPAEAQGAWADALAAIEKLPTRARNTRATQELEARLRQATRQVARNQVNPNTQNLQSRTQKPCL